MWRGLNAVSQIFSPCQEHISGGNAGRTLLNHPLPVGEGTKWFLWLHCTLRKKEKPDAISPVFLSNHILPGICISASECSHVAFYLDFVHLAQRPTFIFWKSFSFIHTYTILAFVFSFTVYISFSFYCFGFFLS